MWREFKILEEHSKERRWFKTDDLDVVIWLESHNQITRFQVTFLDWLVQRARELFLDLEIACRGLFVSVRN